MAGVPVGDTTLLAKLRELDSKATAGPWQAETDGMFPMVAARPHSPVLMEFAVYGRPGDTDSRPEAEATAEFVASLRNALPAVVTLIEAAQKIERAIAFVAREDIHIEAEDTHAWGIILSAALAPFVGEATQ